MAPKNTKNEPGRIFILGIRAADIFYSAKSHEIFSKLKATSAEESKTVETSTAATPKAKRKPGSLSP